MKTNLQIKNVVCQRCVASVEEIFVRLKIPFEKVSLGEALLKKPLKENQVKKLQEEFRKVGFAILENKEEKIVNKIKSVILKEVYEGGLVSHKRMSEVLTTIFSHDYSYLSGLFSTREKISIRDYQKKVKIERAKELLEYNEMNINQISANIGYQGASYFCTFFKKETGLTPLQYQKKHLKKRKGLGKL